MIDADGCVDGHCETREKEPTQGRDIDRPQVILKRDSRSQQATLSTMQTVRNRDSVYFRNSNDENGNYLIDSHNPIDITDTETKLRQKYTSFRELLNHNSKVASDHTWAS